MTREQMIAKTKILAGESDTDVVSLYLDLAGEAIVQKKYPFGDGTETVPEKHQLLQCQIATYLLDKRGATGETAHNENGISRTYGSAHIPAEMLKEVIPFCKALSRQEVQPNEGTD